MATWSTRRKAFYIFIFLLAVIVLIGVPAFLIYYKAPTCEDGMRNGKETGIDCGGDCPRICSADYLSPLVVWSRFQKVGPGYYNVAAYIENPNLEGGVKSVPYVFRLYDNRGILIAERKGNATIPGRRNILVFESSLKTGERIPSRATFEFREAPAWEKHITSYEDLEVLEKKILSPSTEPRLTATLKNAGAKPFGVVDVGAVIYDKDDNVIAFSKSSLEGIAANESVEVVFTWPLPFEKEVGRIEIVPTLPY
jgi:hypothetical protein